MLVKHLVKLEELALPGATDRILSEIGRCCPKLVKLFFQVMSDNPKCYSMGILSICVEDFVFERDCSRASQLSEYISAEHIQKSTKLSVV